MNKQEGEKQISKLVEKYENLTPAQRKQYNEANTRKNFILPLFESLGWDTRSDDVPEEERASGKRVDYAFKINGITKFFLEAKPFSINLDESRWAEQAIWYAYHKSVSWVVLTDFESIKVFNTEWDEQDAERSLVFEISYKDYFTSDKLWFLSRSSIEKGELDEYAEKEFKKPKRVAVDKQLVADLLRWRDGLYADFSGYNPLIDKKKIAENVQKVLNRIIFIRTCEDRGFEERSLQEMVRNWEEGRGKSDELVNGLRVLFKEFDKNYDSKLFEDRILFEGEKFIVDDNALAGVIKETYKGSKGIRWNFNDINGDVLGGIYEQYLGQIQREDGKEKKSSKRKSQGIYYTPRYIVDYIVKNTLGEILKNKPAHEASKIKILDPACGSGSFLIKAFEVLDNHIRRELNQKGDNWLINYARKFNILTSNIYGVDLDPEAVEIAQLNLLIKALEKRERLPNLSHNIERGNSLISGTETELKKYFGKNWKDKKPFNWEERFPDVFKQGGFDVIIGNPPYVNLANIKDKNDREWLKNNFETAKNKSDLYSFFIERAIKLLKDGGLLGFIVSNSWLGTDSFSKFREYLVRNTNVLELVKLTPDVFKDAMVTPVLIFIKKEKIGKNHEIKLIECRNGEFIKILSRLTYERIINSSGFNFSFGLEINFKIPTIKLGEIAKLSMGIKTSDNAKFILNNTRDNDSFPLLRGKDINRYSLNYGGKWIWYKPDLMMKKVGAGPRKPEYFTTPKLLFREITGGGIIATFDSENYFTNNKIHILYSIKNFNLKFILAVVNSKLINFWIKSEFNNSFQVEINQLEKIPIPKIDFSNKKEKAKHDELAKLADKMLKLNKELQKLDPILDEDEYKELKSKIDKIDKEIDERVYKLYGLTPEEIKVVEQNSK